VLVTLFFYGPNSFALRQQLAQMEAAYRAKAGSDFGIERIDGAAVKPQELSAQLHASPFLASSRLVIVEGAIGNKAVAEKLPGLLAGVPETTVAVFVEQEADQRTAAFKVLMKADRVMKFESLSGPRMVAWATAELKRLGGTAEPAAIRELVEIVGEDQWRLAGEINKLVNFDPQVTRKSVEVMVARTTTRSIFDLVEAMTAGRAGEALVALRALMDRRESEMYVLTMVQWQLRNLLLAQAAPAGMSSDELAKAAGMSPYVAGKVLAARRRSSEEGLRRAFAAACDCEFEIKSGRTKAPEAVERLIYTVAGQIG
jgi:DNA polymerase III subunit delta